MRHKHVDRRVLAAMALLVILSAGWRVMPRSTRITAADAPRAVAIDADIPTLAATLDAEIDRLTVPATVGCAAPSVRDPFSVASAASHPVPSNPSAAPTAASMAPRPVPPVLVAILTTEHEGRQVARAAVELAHRVSVVAPGDRVGTFVLAEIGPSAIRWKTPDGTMIEQPTGWSHSRHRIFTPAR